MYFSFDQKIYLAFLFAIPVLIFLHFYGLRNIRGKSLKFANFQAIARVKGIDLYSKSILLLVINILFVLLLVLALSGMTLNREVEASEFSYVIAIDNSESMEATDLSPTRLDAAKQASITFIDALPEEAVVGAISFSGDTRVEIEPTNNKEKVKDSINLIELSPYGGTDINEAVWNSFRLLRDEENKAVIITSDGQINVGELNTTIEDAIENKFIIHTLGIGTVEGGQTSFGLSKLDEDALKSLAYNTGGKYFNIKEDKDLKRSFEDIIEVTKRTGEIQLSSYLLMALLLLYMVKQYLISTHRIIW